MSFLARALWLHGVCKDCRASVHWNGVRWIEGRFQHRCLTRCNQVMNTGDRCGRKPGHRGYCRSRYAMDNERRAKGAQPLAPGGTI